MTAGRTAIGLAALLVAATAAGAGQAATETPAAYAALFDQVWKTVDANFYDPTFHGLDWRALGARYRARLGSVRDDDGFNRLANAMLDELHVSHLFLTEPSRDAAEGGVGIGVQTERFGDARIVTEVAPLSDAQRQGLRRGDRILGASSALYGPLGSAATLTVQGCDGARREVSVRRESAFWPPQHPGYEWRAIAVTPKVSLGYIRIDRFDDGAAELADQAMAELKDTQGIVIDVRGGGGGNLSSLRLVSYFAGPSKPAVALLAKPYLQALGHPVTKADVARLQPTRGAYTNAAIFAAIKQGQGAAIYYTDDVGAKRYRGKVVVVMGKDTGSAGEGFAAEMRMLAAATLIGRPTAGYLLSSDRFPLAGGWTLTIPVDGVWAPDGSDFRDTPTLPDVTVARTAADLCRADDPDLARAEQVLLDELEAS